ncbi:hypothetical protein Ais01nite_72570 [Asanoa ishikariensis]|uniref:Signal transduction histidine kinase n=1 Tax=Asanoa ishikariensis TaxID=137265 RepID=A0A1H3UQH2_9ACTN|nr:histidine kinase [Asanoa ishikariensis]GIF69222.1 hypothetical protein Ais01nite_72570 [Asanoa ishikariensis]SDZ64598.1 Signal transduction histidine kinase [Asanoa ishikariensis]
MTADVSGAPAATGSAAEVAGTRALRAGRVVVSIACATLLVLFAVGVALWVADADRVPELWTAPAGWTADGIRGVLDGWGVPVTGLVAYFVGLEVMLVAVSAAAAYVVLRGPLSWFRLYLAWVLVLFATAGGGVPLVVGALYPATAAVAEGLPGLAWMSLFPLAYVFPDGRFVPPWSRWLAAGWAVWLAGVLVTGSSGESPIEVGTLLLLFASCVAAQVYRYARVSGPVQRVQTRWVLYALALRLLYNVVLLLTPVGAVQAERTPRGLATYAVLMLVSYLVAAALPAAIAIAIIRHRLFDIDVVINRTLVWTVLTGFVVGAYTAVVGGVGALWRGGGLTLPLVATGLVAVAFSPVRERVQRRVDRLVYGERHDPYGVLSALGRRLAVIMAPHAVADSIVETIARALKAPYVALTAEPDGEVVASVGILVSDVELFVLRHRGVTLGHLVLSAGDRLTSTDRRLLADLADHCGAALFADRESARTRRLATDLQLARQRLVNAREEERRRIRRDLHDSLGPALGGQALTIDTARALLASDPSAADRLLRDLKDQTQENLAEVRRLARRLRPPVLDELGLTTALRHVGDRYGHDGLVVDVDVPELPELPAAVEVAAYRIAHEAITNVVRHADARACLLRLAVAGATLCVEVRDDGCGIAADVPAGVGTASMRERAEELGGTLEITDAVPGTLVRARLPLPTTE